MKKIISTMLAFTMFISVIYPCQSVIAEEISKANALSIGNEIALMCAEYDEEYTVNGTEDKTINTRLIVKAEDTIDEYGAVDSVYGFGYAFLQYADEESAQTAKEMFEMSGYTVDYDSVVTVSSATSTYSIQSNEWAYEESDAVSALDYYESKDKPDISIAIIDSGMNYNHELLKDRVVRTKVDLSTEASGDELDKYGHGTKVAGAIAKSTPSNVKLSCYKILDSKGVGTSSEVISAFAYIKQLSDKPDIINCSFGSNSLGTVIDELVDMGVTVVAASGNEGKEVSGQPAILDNVITVAATNRYSRPCSFSNYGYQVDISAPGENVHTSSMSSNSSYVFANGTSLAAPLVSAAAAIILMENKDYTPAQVKKKLLDTAVPFKKSTGYHVLYGVGVVNFSNIINGARCENVTANYKGGVYREDISVELECESTSADIYYTTDGTLPTKADGIKYTAPIDVTETTRIIAASFAGEDAELHSAFKVLDYYIFKNGEAEYVINKNGLVLSYLGGETDLVVPKTINGIIPTKIGQNCFNGADINSIALPNTVRTIGEYAFNNTKLKSIKAIGITSILTHSFCGCDMLTDIDLSKLKSIGKEALHGCKLLTQDLEFPVLEQIDEKGFAGTYFKSIKLPKCTTIKANAFEECAAEEIVLNKAAAIGNYAFRNCKNLKNLYAPKVTSIGGNDFKGCTNIEMIFAPMLENLTAAIPSNVTVYCSDRLTDASFSKEYSDYKCTIVSPDYTPGLAVADNDGYADSYIHIDSDRIAKSKGGQIRTRDKGLRFGFEFDENDIGFDFNKYAENVEYGFVYTYESDSQINDSLRANDSSTNHVRTADKRTVDGSVSTYNAVFTGIPASHYDDKISARAYVCIDGMYFYSPVTTRSFSDVAARIIADDEIDQNTKNEVKTLLEKEV